MTTQKTMDVSRPDRQTSFFIKAIDEEQKEWGRRDEKRAQIEELQAELDSPEPLIRPSKLAPLPNLVKQEQEKKLEDAKERQRSILDQLTYDLMNPVVLVEKGKQKRKEHRRNIR